MPVLSVPHVVVLEPVDVHIEQSAIVEVDVSNEEAYGVPSEPLPPEIARRLYFMRDIKVRQHTAPTGCFLIVKIETALLQALAGKTPGDNFQRL